MQSLISPLNLSLFSEVITHVKDYFHLQILQLLLKLMTADPKDLELNKPDKSTDFSEWTISSLSLAKQSHPQDH